MNYKNLLALHCLHDPITSLKPAVAFAKDLRAKLEIRVLNQALPMGTMVPMGPMVSMQNLHYDWSKSLTDDFVETEKRVGDIMSWIEDKEVDTTVTSSCQQLGLIDDEVSAAALYADLVLYHRCDQSLVSGLMSRALEGAIFDAGKPALILTQRSDSIGCDFQSVSIAWDPVPEAMRALSASLPILKRALNVSVFVVSKKPEGVDADSRAERVLDWLQNHEIEASIEHVPQGEQSVSDALINHINNTDRDLIVMGAYGHSRLAEHMFSGVSHTVLDKSNKSLFIAH